MKEIYSFSVDLETKTTKEVEKTIVDKETGKEEKVKAEEEVVTSEPVRIILKEPNRRQVEEADMEYSIEMSQCVKRGILTKAMLAIKYTDTGGLVAEEDAKSLAKSYGNFFVSLVNFTSFSLPILASCCDADSTQSFIASYFLGYNLWKVFIS